MSDEIGFEVKINRTFEEGLEKVVAALKAEGFGVLTKIDMQATLQEKLGEKFRPFIILGACNPPLAHRALSTDPVVGLMLPCNVTVEADPEGGTLARIANPELMMRIGTLEKNEILKEIAQEARERLERVACALLEQ
jgi:uncharacterized protein (DUF302 family)